MIGKATCLDRNAWKPLDEELLKDLAAYSSALALLNHRDPVTGFNIGHEHPVQAATMILLARAAEARSVLEVGYQCGGMLIPLCLAQIHGGDPLFEQIVGIDNYQGSGSGRKQDLLIESYLRTFGFESFQLIGGEDFTPYAFQDFAFDMVILDHDKPLTLQHVVECIEYNVVAHDGIIVVCDIDIYPEETWKILRRENARRNGALGVLHDMKEGFDGIVCPNIGIVERIPAHDLRDLREDPVPSERGISGAGEEDPSRRTH